MSQEFPSQNIKATARKPRLEDAYSAGQLSLGRATKRLSSLLGELQREQPKALPEQYAIREPRDVGRSLKGYIFNDALALAVAYLAAWGFAAFINSYFLGRYELTSLVLVDTSRLTQFSLIALGIIFWFERSGHYRIRMPYWMETRKILEAMGFGMLINGFLEFASKQEFSRLWLISTWAFAAIGIIILRSAWRSLQKRHGQWLIPTLLVGRGATAEEARAALQVEHRLGYEIVAQIDDLPLAFQQANSSWRNLCSAHKTDYVIIALDGPDLSLAKEPLKYLIREPVPFSVTPPLHYLPVGHVTALHFFNNDVTLLTRSRGLDEALPRFIKRSFDIAASLTVLVLGSPLFLFLALLVRKDGGPAFYGHKRLGLNGKAFRCFKFRSMVPHSEIALQRYLDATPSAQAEWQSSRKLRHDPRVTRIGAFLRRTSLDELPQVYNVLKGEMSIVGPRPIVIAETKKYEGDIVDYYRVRPGITGVWQVSGRNNVSYGQRVRMDSWYVRNWSLWHDITIIFKTIPALVKRRGAY